MTDRRMTQRELRDIVNDMEDRAAELRQKATRESSLRLDWAAQDLEEAAEAWLGTMCPTQGIISFSPHEGHC